MSPIWQLHLPPVQCVSFVHVLPQPPQFASSAVVSTQALLQTVSPEAHCDTHLPCEHSLPVAQGLPHAPQFVPSAMRLLQPLWPQSVWPAPQAHWALWHVIPWPHVRKQPPQLSGSVARFTHAVPQKVRSEDGHDSWQTPLTHDAPGGQLAHPPLEPELPLPFAFCEHPGRGANAAATRSNVASRIDDRTRLYVYFGMASRRPQQARCLPSSSHIAAASTASGVCRQITVARRKGAHTVRTRRSCGPRCTRR